MGFFDRFRSAPTTPAVSPSPGTTIDDLRTLARSHSKKALKQLRKAGAVEYEAFGIEGLHHERYVTLYAELTARAAAVPSVAIALWSKWDRPTNGLLVELARKTSEDLLYLVAPRKVQKKTAAAEAEALLTLATHSTCPLVVLGEADLMVRTTFLRDAEPLLDADAEEIIQDLIDAASKRSLKGQWVTI